MNSQYVVLLNKKTQTLLSKYKIKCCTSIKQVFVNAGRTQTHTQAQVNQYTTCKNSNNKTNIMITDHTHNRYS